MGVLGEKGEGIKKLQNSSGGVKYSRGNILSNIVITMCRARWLLELSGGIALEII